MCWSQDASGAMVGAGAVAAAITFKRNAAPAIWLTLGYFAIMEALQVWGYVVLNDCGTTSNRTVTILSYLHITAQPFFINAFAMELVPKTVKRRARAWVFAACGVSSLVMLAQIMPLSSQGNCLPGSPLCGDRWCTVAGDWHIGWEVPYNGLMQPVERFFGTSAGFPTYIIAAFLIPLTYGAWRFVLLHAMAGPILASALTTDPNEMPAIWCLFSIAILLIALSPPVRKSISTTHWWGRTVASGS